MIASWTFACPSCGPWDHYYEPPRPTTTACPKCGVEAGWGRVKKNQIHRTLSGRKYGEIDPQFGCVVESYEHKQRLLKERGWEELPPETQEEIAEDRWNQEHREIQERDPNVDIVEADTLEELREKMYTRSDVDMSATGEASVNRPMMKTFSPLGD